MAQDTYRRGRTYAPAMAKVQSWAGRLHTALFRISGGRIGGRMMKSPVLLLNTTGRKSGKRRTTPLLYLEDDGTYAIVASNGGTATHPAWLFNLRAHPESTVEIGGREVRVRAEEAGPEDRERLWQRLVAMYPAYAEYQTKTDREIPVLLLHPSERARGGSVAEVGTITREELKAKMDVGDLVLLEVLGAASYERGHLPGAIRSQDPDGAEAEIPDKDAFVVAYCSDFH